MPPSPQHLLQCEESRGVILVRFTRPVLREDLEISTIFQELNQLAEDQPQRPLLLCFQNVTSIASYFIGKLILLGKKTTAANGRLILCGLTPIVDEIIDLMRLRRKFEIYSTEQEALELF